ncbi:N-recognin zinc finger protein (macronuclear) [Tetrahymena thermophila SB210]|uniref:E3 ubiquitin-protein ligase n=1 Tax=Tetrahymena thermophila (strain SB210) TaxID=312017 RepID=Q23Q62_TETTS|nr:N-recognin zinc finger protein [Tetrahymena thermophila SB210]EAR98722.2 N-recognin zinc finger protein [Tetrahymena thermophila SB210]|eukprot:XP_001018967.2 N-recognin zinc finger protein [Tetrahymena thermophila SB210]
MNNIHNLMQMLQQQGINVLQQFGQHPPQSQSSEQKEIFKFSQITLPQNLSQFEKNISELIHKLFSCNPCFNFQHKTEDQLCDLCTKTLVELQKTMFVGIFEKEKHLEELSAFWKTGNNIKVYCGKILKINDVGYKCYDCEMDPTCIICKECFEKGDHRGHRTVVQKGCQGCCDCGDIEAWKKEGFCSDHKGFLTQEQLSIEQINKKYRDNIIKGFKFLFYCIFSQIEDLISNTQNGQQIQLIQNNLTIQKVVEYTIVLIDKIVMKNTVLQNLFNHILCEIRFDEDRFKFRHICPDIISRVTIDNKKTHPLHKCQCSILELMLRYIVSFNNNVQEKIKNFYISMFNLYHFKQNLITAYTKMFNFFYYYDDSKNNKDSHPFLTNFVDLNVQLFTSDILAGYVLDQKTEDYIIEYFMAKNQQGSSRKNSMNEKAQHRKDSENHSKQVKPQSRKGSEKIQKQENQTNQSQSQQNQNQQENQQEEERKEQNVQFEEIEIEPERLQQHLQGQQQQQGEDREEDFETEEEEGQEGEDEEYYDEEEEEEEDEGQFSDEDNIYMDMEQDEQIDDSLPLFDCEEQKKDANKIQNFVNEYYFGNILDKLLLFASYSFKQKSVVEQFFKTFYHIKYISQKEFSLSKLIEKDIFRQKFVEILSKMHYKIDSKLKRKFETIYSTDSYFFNACDCEKLMISILRRILSYLHSEKKNDQNYFNKIHFDYMKLIMKKIIETTEKYEKQQLSDISSIHIPLHRALIILVMSYFKFDFDKVNSQSLNQLARSLNLDYEQFGQFFIAQMKYPLNVISFIKELDCGVWNFHGEEFKYLSTAYISQDLGFQIYDTVFIQFVLKMAFQELSLEQICQNFSTKKEFYDIINMRLVTNSKKDSADFLEKNEKVLGEFFSFTVYSLLDQVSLYGLAQSILHKTSDEIQPYLKYTNSFISSFMHQFKSASIQEVQEGLIKTFGKYQDISTFLMQVCTFNKSTKKFSLMESNSKLCEPNFFYWSPMIKSSFHDKTFQKYQNSKEMHIYLLGNAELNQTQKSSFKYIFNANSLSFIEDLIRQPLISKQFQQKKSIAQQHLVTPILKLILLYIQNQNLYTNREPLELHVTNILTFLTQYKDNFVKELADTIQYLQEQLASSNQLFFQKGTSQTEEDKEDAQKKKELIKKKQEEILKLFQQRSATYSEKNKDELFLERTVSDSECCVICKKSLDDESEFGYGVYCQKTNIYEFSELKGFIQQNYEESVHQSSIKQEATKNFTFWNLKEGNWYVNSCFHHIHKSCYQQYLYTKNQQKSNGQRHQYFYEHEYKCPLCNKLLNSFLTLDSSQSLKTLTESFSAYDIKEQSNLVWSQPISVSESSIQQQTEQDFKTHEIQQKIISEYEILNKKRKCEMNKASNSENDSDSSNSTDFKYKKYQNKKDHLGDNIDYHFLSTQIETINITQYEDDDFQKNKDVSQNMEIESESSDEKQMNRIENILLNHLRITDFECSPNTLISQPKKLSLLRQILMNLNLSLNQSCLEKFYIKRKNYCITVMKLLSNIQLTTSSSSFKNISNNLLENDLKEMYTRFLFYSLNYFHSEKESLQLIQKTIVPVLLAKFIQICIVQQRKKQQGNENQNFNLNAEQINTFNDNEACQFNVDILQRVWNLLSLFFDYDTKIKQNLNLIFDDSKDEVLSLLRFMNVDISSQEEQKQFIELCLKHQFNHNNLNILKITPNNTSLNFVSLEHNFNDLFKKYQRVKCSICGDLSKYRDGNPTMCLICGDVICSITCKSYEQINAKNHLGNLNLHAKQMHCSSSLFLDLTTSQVIYVSYPHNCPQGELYANSFGIPFKKNAKDWSQFQLDNSILSKLHQTTSSLEIVDQIKLNEVKTNMLYKYHFY